jgi:hypothetical protein
VNDEAVDGRPAQQTECEELARRVTVVDSTQQSAVARNEMLAKNASASEFSAPRKIARARRWPMVLSAVLFCLTADLLSETVLREGTFSWIALSLMGGFLVSVWMFIHWSIWMLVQAYGNCKGATNHSVDRREPRFVLDERTRGVYGPRLRRHPILGLAAIVIGYAVFLVEKVFMFMPRGDWRAGFVFTLVITLVASLRDGTRVENDFALTWIPILIRFPVIFALIAGMSLLIAFTGYCVGKLSVNLITLGKRLRCVRGDEVLAFDQRAPILFLRSFRDDHLGVPTYFGTPRARIEELLVRRLEAFGPVIAVGEPNETLPQTGAHRLYFDDATWKESVSGLIRRARLIVMALGDSPGLEWEWQEVLKHSDESRVLVFCPYLRWGDAHLEPNLYARWRQSSSRFLPHELPERIGDASFIYFESGWRPVPFNPPRVKWFHSFVRQPLPTLRHPLAPVFAVLMRDPHFCAWYSRALPPFAVFTIGVYVAWIYFICARVYDTLWIGSAVVVTAVVFLYWRRLTEPPPTPSAG